MQTNRTTSRTVVMRRSGVQTCIASDTVGNDMKDVRMRCNKMGVQYSPDNPETDATRPAARWKQVSIDGGNIYIP